MCEAKQGKDKEEIQSSLPHQEKPMWLSRIRCWIHSVPIIWFTQPRTLCWVLSTGPYLKATAQTAAVRTMLLVAMFPFEAIEAQRDFHVWWRSAAAFREETATVWVQIPLLKLKKLSSALLSAVCFLFQTSQAHSICRQQLCNTSAKLKQ